ncbi:LacI family DNA-binding transcriptional regulator [Sphingobacterium corticis]|uniref:LacI family DNA-binding transcriptional regulator n=1 Tax=Sphingobacterium corticis TaxID=1812823 RepID=A0ABW5NHE6_9SPHI
MANITLKQLAKMLGISVSSVSKALNDSHEISEETKIKVRKLAKQEGYRPNMFGKSLKTGRTNTVAVIIPYLANPFQSQILEGAHQAAYANDYKLIFIQSREDQEIERDLLHSLIDQRIDGIIISPSANSDPTFLRAINEEVPIVLIDRIDFDVETHKIGVDNERGAFDATEHLIASGRRDILVLNGKGLGVTQKRTSGYQKALLANYIPFRSEYIVEIDYQQSKQEMADELRQILKEKLQMMPDKIGLLGNTDVLTVTALAVLADLGIEVPNQVAVIGFSNTEAAEAMNPSLSTVVQPAIEMGRLGIEKLIELIKCKNRNQLNPTITTLAPIMALRKSTKVLPASS